MIPRGSSLPPINACVIPKTHGNDNHISQLIRGSSTNSKSSLPSSENSVTLFPSRMIRTVSKTSFVARIGTFVTTKRSAEALSKNVEILVACPSENSTPYPCSILSTFASMRESIDPRDMINRARNNTSIAIELLIAVTSFFVLLHFSYREPDKEYCEQY